jgi:hypothetical protein
VAARTDLAVVVATVVMVAMASVVAVPSPASAYTNIQTLQTEVAFGQYVRNVHRWSAHLMVLAVAAQALKRASAVSTSARLGASVISVTWMFMAVVLSRHGTNAQDRTCVGRSQSCRTFFLRYRGRCGSRFRAVRMVSFDKNRAQAARVAARGRSLAMTALGRRTP